MFGYTSIFRYLAVGFVMSLALICASSTGAQSGRRAKPSVPIAVPTPEPTPTPSKRPDDSKPAFRFIVGIDKTGDFSRLPLYVFGGVIDSCADRLDDSGSVKAEISRNDMSRSDAIRQAKAETETYIVWLRLPQDNLSGQRGMNDNDYDVYVQYSVLAPVTAKQVASGNTYPEGYRNKRIRVPTPTTEGDYYLNQAARGAAERILDHFHVPIRR